MGKRNDCKMAKQLRERKLISRASKKKKKDLLFIFNEITCYIDRSLNFEQNLELRFCGEKICGRRMTTTTTTTNSITSLNFLNFQDQQIPKGRANFPANDGEDSVPRYTHALITRTGGE